MKMENELKQLKEEGLKIKKELLEELSVKDFNLFLKYDMNKFKIHMLENKIKLKERLK